MEYVVNKVKSFFDYASEKVEVSRSDKWLLNTITVMVYIYVAGFIVKFIG